MTHRSLRAAIAAAAAVAALGQGAVRPAAAQGAAAPISITGAVPDAGSATLTVAGSGLGGRPFVTLDLVPLDVQLAIDARLVASVPIAAMPPGTYLLTISRGPGPGDTASLPVTVGGGNTPAERSANPSRPAPSPGPGDAAATVGDRTITVADVDREWQRTDPAGYLEAMRGLYESRRRAANALVSDALLAREAAARGVTSEALLAEEIPKRTIPLPDAAVTSLYASLGDRARGATLDQMRAALRAWLQRNTEPELAKMNYIEELMKTTVRADVLLSAPSVDVTIGPSEPALGPAGAPVVLVAFGDLQSTEYTRVAPSLARVRETFGDRVRIVFKPLPTFGAASAGAAEAAACAHAQGRFWAYHDAAAKPGGLDAGRLKALAAEVGLDRRTFDACVDDGRFRELPRQAIDEAARYGLRASPAFLVNGRMAPEPPPFLPPFEFFKRLIEDELQRQARSAR